jgi:hypothetical protein
MLERNSLKCKKQKQNGFVTSSDWVLDDASQIALGVAFKHAAENIESPFESVS